MSTKTAGGGGAGALADCCARSSWSRENAESKHADYVATVIAAAAAAAAAAAGISRYEQHSARRVDYAVQPLLLQHRSLVRELVNDETSMLCERCGLNIA